MLIVIEEVICVDCFVDFKILLLVMQIVKINGGKEKIDWYNFFFNIELMLFQFIEIGIFEIKIKVKIQ